MVPTELVVPHQRDVAVSLFVGEDFVAEEERRFEKARFARLSHLHAGSTEDLLSTSPVEGAMPMLRVPLRADGGHLLLVSRNASHIELEPRKFEDYLRHEGLTHVQEARARLGESNKPGRERYTRYLKTLIQVGGTRDETSCAMTGQTLEIMPDENPVFIQPGHELAVRVHFRGEPLADAKVEAFSRDGADVRAAEYMTNSSGQIRVLIDRHGVWLIRMVHMVRCEKCEDADWESFWTSYTFATANPSGLPVAAPSMFAPAAPRVSSTMIGIAGAIAVVATIGSVYFARRRRHARRRKAPRE